MEQTITLDYGSGGQKTSALIEKMILPCLQNEFLGELGDGAVLPGAGQLVFSTDSFVVSPLIFPGGDIGKLAVCGTVNDICMAGGDPKYLSLSLILEEGISAGTLEMILASVRDAAEKAGVLVVTGDTKVVERGRGDGVYINTAGIGFLKTPGLSPKRMEPGDAVLVSGTVGDHGMAVMLARNAGLMEASIESDCGPLKNLAHALGSLGGDLRCLRDPTRGGLATTLNEFVEGTSLGIELEEKAVPVRPDVAAAADLLGLDPFYAACEGRLIAVVKEDRAEEALALLRQFPEGSGAARIGTVMKDYPGRLIIRTPYGGRRIAAKLAGAQLPRIC